MNNSLQLKQKKQQWIYVQHQRVPPSIKDLSLVTGRLAPPPHRRSSARGRPCPWPPRCECSQWARRRERAASAAAAPRRAPPPRPANDHHLQQTNVIRKNTCSGLTTAAKHSRNYHNDNKSLGAKQEHGILIHNKQEAKWRLKQCACAFEHVVINDAAMAHYGLERRKRLIILGERNRTRWRKHSMCTKHKCSI